MQQSTGRARIAAWWLCGLLSVLWLGGGTCQPAELEGDQDYASSVDKVREGASEVSLNATVIDSVDREHGDTNDWKYFTVPAVGVVTIKVSFDNPKAEGEVVLTDARGKSISTYQDVRRSVLDNMTFKAEPGRYYLHIWANEADSDYTLLVDFKGVQ
jgi:hypothetical protein